MFMLGMEIAVIKRRLPSLPILAATTADRADGASASTPSSLKIEIACCRLAIFAMFATLAVLFARESLDMTRVSHRSRLVFGRCVAWPKAKMANVSIRPTCRIGPGLSARSKLDASARKRRPTYLAYAF